jgi:hypothetical protein
VFDFWTAPDTAPVLGGGPTAPFTATPNVASVVPFANATVTDAQLVGSFGSDFSGTTLTVQRYVGTVAAPDASDVFLSNGTPGAGFDLQATSATAGNVLWNGTVLGTFSETSGKLTIAFSATPGTVSATLVQDVLRNITYESTLANNPLVPGIVIGARIDDANNDPVILTGGTPDPSGPHDQGVGGDLLSNVLTATIDVNASTSATFHEPNDTNPASAPSPVTVAPAIDLTDIAATAGTPRQVTLTITNPHPEDVLTFTNTADITGTYSDGSLTLTPVNGHTPTLAEWQAAIRSVQYYDSSPTPDTQTRDLTITLTGSTATATEPGTIAIVPVDDSPILNTAVPVALTDSTEYQGSGTPAPSGPVGTLVSQLAGLNGTAPGNVTDTDGPGLTNGGTPTAPGIAITGFSTTDAGGRSVGTWYYSTDGGTTWIAFPSTISATQPLDLAPTARIAFQPTATDFNGQIPNAITFRAWDGFDGTANGTQATDLNGVTQFGQNAANNAPATAYSIATESLPLMIDNVNNAPFASGSATLPPVSTAEQHPPGETVTQLFGGGFSDPLDQQAIPGANPLGSTSNGLAGVAVTGNAATSNQGIWEYSTNGGSTWTAIPTNVSLTNAVILPVTAKIAFLPENGFSGNPGILTVNLIDSSSGVPATASTGVDIAATGGSTQYSAGTMTLGTQVLALPFVAPSAPIEPAGPLTGAFPDDNQQAPSGVQFWTTDDYLERPLIPDLSLVGSVANRFIIETQHAVISVPSNIFVDSLPNAQLSYEAKLPDGTSLPSWLTFNPNDLTFSGTPPRGSHGRLEILIRARDIAGNTADANFNILIGREQQDLLGLLRTGRAHGLPTNRLVLPPAPHADVPAAVPHGPAAPGPAGHRVPAAAAAAYPIAVPDRIAARAALLADLPPVHGSGAFSSALHAAGPMSVLGRARAWLDTLTGMDHQRPAA